MRRNSRWVLMGCGVAFLCLIAGLLISSFIGGEKKIQQHLKRLYALDDPRFMQELGVLLWPPFLQDGLLRR